MKTRRSNKPSARNNAAPTNRATGRATKRAPSRKRAASAEAPAPADRRAAPTKHVGAKAAKGKSGYPKIAPKPGKKAAAKRRAAAAASAPANDRIHTDTAPTSAPRPRRASTNTHTAAPAPTNISRARTTKPTPSAPNKSANTAPRPRTTTTTTSNTHKTKSTSKPNTPKTSTTKPNTRPTTPDPATTWATGLESVQTFEQLNLDPRINAALQSQGYSAPTPIQAVTIPPALEARDILGCAQTGTGKTAAFALPIIHRLLSGDLDHKPGAPDRPGAPRLPRVLVLAPTRELAQQIADSFGTYAKGSGLRGTTVYGGVSQRKQEIALSRGVDVLIATPGRLIDLIEQNIVDLSAIRILAIDEADRMLDMGFIQPIRRIAEQITTDRQTLLFSATMPAKVMALADTLLNNPVRVAVERTAEREPKITQSLFRIPRNADKQAILESLLVQHQVRCGVVFTKTKHGAERVGKKLRAAGLNADAIHGNKTQAQRQRALDALRDGRSNILVATDVAARGLDVEGVTHVFNFDLPIEPEAYIHRIGRTGRAGAEGLAIAFCAPEERGLLKAIERFMGKPIPVNPDLPPITPTAPRHAPDEADHTDDADDHTPPRRIMRPTPNWQPHFNNNRRKPARRH
ncbi:MAG: DEAD/DEAH box helicase [Phycisphaerales bacterium]